uniref:ParB/Sulfiredoxin domain-containing protein n=1 Tax=viral metagenome TaxID=1070528 RepID=A0A6M3M8T4_9ZZZZ
MELKEGQKIPIDKLLDPEVELHPEISKWRDTITVDMKLLNSLKEGQIQAIVFRLLKNGKHQLVAGARRYFHQKLLKTPWVEIPKVVKEMTEQEALLTAASENMFRKDFTPWEEARVINSLLKGKLTIKDLAKRFGVSESYIRSRRDLMKLPEKIRKRFAAKDIGIGYASPMLKLEKYPEAQDEMIEKILKGKESSYYGFKTIEKAEEFVNETLKAVKDQEALLEKYGPCPVCGSNDIAESYGNERLQCHACQHSWHGITKEPWEYYRAKQNLEEMGIKIEEAAPGTLKLTPEEVASVLARKAREKERAEQEHETEKVPEKFRLKIPLEDLVTPLLSENIQKVEFSGSTIEIQLIEDTEMHFVGMKKDYKSGELARIEVTGYSSQEDAKRVHAHIAKCTE